VAIDVATNIVATALVALLVVCGAAPASAATGTFELAQVIELVKREVATAETGGDPARPGLRVDEVQIDLNMVEIGGKAGRRLVVPGAEFGQTSGSAGADAKPALRRHVLLELRMPQGPDTAVGSGTPAAAATGATAGGMLSRAIADLVASARAGVGADPAFEAKRAVIDLEFVLDRDSKGDSSVLVFAGDRRLDVRNVQKLKLKLSAKERKEHAPPSLADATRPTRP
jgi:hypothetical protein